MSYLTARDTNNAIAYNRERHGADPTAAIKPMGLMSGDGWSAPLISQIVRWQLRHGLSPDGMVGPITEATARELAKPTTGKPATSAVIGGLPRKLECDVVTWYDSPDVDLLRARAREARWMEPAGAPDEIVVHESVTRSMETTQRILARRGLGVHFMIDRSGRVTQHADPVGDVCWHMPTRNHRSVGIEVVNPYEPRHMPDAPAIDDAPWAHGNSYVLPTRAQIRAFVELMDGLHEHMQISREIRGLVGDVYHLHQIPTGSPSRPRFVDPAPGVWAHHHIGGHSDGAWPVLVLALMQRGDCIDTAYDRAVELARGVRRKVELT